MPKFIDIKGKRFNQLFVLERVGTSNVGQPLWLCKCDCGNQITVTSGTLRQKQKSCRECFIKRQTQHGLSKHSSYHTWVLMHDRCYNKDNIGYPDYGGRGISVCERWHNVELFIADVGERPTKNHSIDRFPDTNGNYEPSNWRWATRKQQQRNTTTNVYLTLNGRVATMIEWSEITQIPYPTLRYRRKAHWSVKDMLTVPIGRRKPKRGYKKVA